MTGDEEALELINTPREWRCRCGATATASVVEAVHLGWLLSFPNQKLVKLSDFATDACPSCARDGRPN